MTQQRYSRHRFMFSRFNKKDRELFQLMIRSLGGVCLESEYFDQSCTHLICRTLVRTEKFLGACATGKWILHESYIHDSFSKKAWLDEEAYEWNNNMHKELTASLGRETLLSIPKQCRIAYSGLSLGPFVNWNVALVCEKSKQQTYKRLLECGGATVTCVRLPIPSTTLMMQQLTHVIVDELLISANKKLLKSVKELRDLGVACVKEVYIGDYLTTFPKPKIEEYLLPNGYKPQGKQNSDRKSQWNSSKSMKRTVNRLVKDEQLSERKTKNKVQSELLLTPEKDKNNQNVVKDVVWLTPMKCSTLMQSDKSNKCQRKRKILLKHKPSQQTIVHWLIDKKESRPSVSLGKKDQVKSPLDNDVTIVDPKYVQTILSPMKSTPSKNLNQYKNRICRRVLPKAKRVTPSFKRNNDVEGFSKGDLSEQGLHNEFGEDSSGTDAGKDSVIKSISVCNQGVNIDSPVCEIKEELNCFTALVSSECRNTLSAHGSPSEMVCDMSSWLQTCSLNQCHDVIESNADKIDMQVPTKLVHAILDTLMEDNDGWFPYRVLSAIQTMTVSCCCLPAHILSQIMRSILWSSTDERQANTAYATLSHILELYPPVTNALQKLHLESLSECSVAEHKMNGEWIFIKDVLNGVLKLNHHNMQYQYNSFLLLKYIVSMLQKNFNKYCSSHQNHGIPLIAEIFWPKRYREMNSACLDVISFLVNVVKANGLPRKMETVELLQSFVAMVAHCLVFTDPAVCCQSVSQLPLSASLFIRRLVYTINDLQDAGHLKLILNTISSPWIVFKVTHSLMDLYDMVLLDYEDYEERLKTFNAMLTFYTRLIPSDHGEVKYIHSKTSSALNPTESKMSIPDITSDKTSKKNIYGNNTKQMTNGLHQLFSAGAKQRRLDINKRNCKGETLLHRACIRNDITKLKQLLHTPGINVNISDFAGWTPLHEACNLGRLECVIELLKYRPQSSITSFYQPGKENTSKVDIFLAGDHGISVLHDAVMNDHIDVARILLQYGGDRLLEMKTDAGETALDLACSAGMKQLLQKARFSKDELFMNGVTHLLDGESVSDTAKKLYNLRVIEDKYKELEKQGRTISSTDCERYIMLVYHLIVSYMKHYNLKELASQCKNNNNLSLSQHDSAVAGNIISQAGLVETVHNEIYMLKQLKTFVCNFEEHLKRLCTELYTEQMYLLSVLHVLADCYTDG